MHTVTLIGLLKYPNLWGTQTHIKLEFMTSTESVILGSRIEDLIKDIVVIWIGMNSTGTKFERLVIRGLGGVALCDTGVRF